MLSFAWSPLHYAICILVLMAGTFSFIKNRKNKDFIAFLNKFKYLAIFPAIDLFTTFLFLRKGFSEANPIGRVIFENLGVFSFLTLYILVIISGTLFLSAIYSTVLFLTPLEERIWKRKDMLETCKKTAVITIWVLMVVAYSFVYLWNLGVIRPW